MASTEASPLVSGRHGLIRFPSVLPAVNLKLTGQEPSTHPVHADLSRVRSYFGKIKSCENGGASATSASHNEAPTLPGQERRMKVDAQAAGRFIKGAIGTHTKFQVSDDEGGGGGTEGAKQDAAPSSSSSRTVKDPFDGYAAAQGEAAESPAPSPSPATKKKRKASTSVAGADAASSPKGTSSSSLKSKKSQKKLKSSGGGGGGK